MSIAVAFLRAVNLGRRVAPAAVLAKTVEGLGYPGAWTFVNSGNVVLDASQPLGALETELQSAFETALGFEATTFVRSHSQLVEALQMAPFTVADADTYFITFLKEPLDPAQTAALEGLSNDFDTLVVVGPDVHWHMKGRSSASQLKTKQWADVVGRNGSTSRNTTMLRRLVAKIDARSG